MKNVGVVVLSLLFFASILTVTLVSAKFATEQQAVTVGYQCLVNITNKTSLSLEEAVFSTFALGYSNLTRDVFNAEKSAGESCWPSSGCTLKRTAQVALAYDLTQRNTSEIEKWIISKNATATGIDWFLEVDVQNQIPATCTVREDLDTAALNTITIGADQKISGNPGSCFTLARDNYLLRVSDTCMEKSFEISCNEDFLTTMIYKKVGSETYYISSESHTAAPEGTTSERVGARCFKTGAQCDYEGSLWAAVALQQLGRDVTPFVPYILALADEDQNKQFLPQAFSYILTESSDSYSELTQSQQQNRYWRAAVNNSRLFDTSLALMALQGTNAQEVSRAKTYLMDIQDNNGCWNNKNIRDTAFVLSSAWPQANLPVYNDPTSNNITGPGLGLLVASPVENGVYNGTIAVDLTGQNSTSVLFSIDNSTNVTYGGVVFIELKNGTHILRAHARNNTNSVMVTRTFSIVNSPLVPLFCTNSTQCASGFVCQNNFCISNTGGMCTSDAQCGLGRACQSGSCVNVQLCTSGAQCTSGICTNGVCNATNGSSSSGGGRPRPITNVSTNTTGKSSCEIGGFSCGSAFSCLDAGGILKSGYSCTGRMECCSVKPATQQSCSVQQGNLCTVNQRCEGSSGPASDGSCCFGSCVAIAGSDENACEIGGYGVCSASCSDQEYDSGYACATPGFSCCSTSTGNEKDEGSSSLWFWIIFLVILIGLIVAGIMYREKIKLWWFKHQNKGTQPKGPFGGAAAGILPHRPPQFGGFMPSRPAPRPMARPFARPGIARPAAAKPAAKPTPKDKELEDTLKKLKEMSE